MSYEAYNVPGTGEVRLYSDNQISGPGFTIDPQDVNVVWYIAKAAEDKRLGRWRSAEYPDVVVYPRKSTQDTADAFNEVTGDLFEVGRTDTDGVAAEYFAAHPVLPEWTRAKHNEVWLVTLNGGTEAYVVNANHMSGKPVFANSDTYLTVFSSHIEAARRIFPE